jgi:hypothetical protein
MAGFDPTKRSYGVKDYPDCPTCENSLRVSKRVPHPDLGGKYELQTLTCASCGCQIQRNADRFGGLPDKGIHHPELRNGHTAAPLRALRLRR